MDKTERDLNCSSAPHFKACGTKAKHYQSVQYLIGRFWVEVQDEMPEAR